MCSGGFDSNLNWKLLPVIGLTGSLRNEDTNSLAKQAQTYVCSNLKVQATGELVMQGWGKAKLSQYRKATHSLSGKRTDECTIDGWPAWQIRGHSHNL